MTLTHRQAVQLQHLMLTVRAIAWLLSPDMPLVWLRTRAAESRDGWQHVENRLDAAGDDPHTEENTVARYTVRYVHQTATQSHNPGKPVTLSPDDLADKRSLAKALRTSGTLRPNTRIREYRVSDGEIVAFPNLPGTTTYWHSVILTEIKS